MVSKFQMKMMNKNLSSLYIGRLRPAALVFIARLKRAFTIQASPKARHVEHSLLAVFVRCHSLNAISSQLHFTNYP